MKARGSGAAVRGFNFNNGEKPTKKKCYKSGGAVKKRADTKKRQERQESTKKSRQ